MSDPRTEYLTSARRFALDAQAHTEALPEAVNAVVNAITLPDPARALVNIGYALAIVAMLTEGLAGAESQIREAMGAAED